MYSHVFPTFEEPEATPEATPDVFPEDNDSYAVAHSNFGICFLV